MAGMGGLRSYRPQRDYLKLISLGRKSALAERSGLAEGDLVIGVNGERVASAADLSEALRNVAGSATLFVARGNNLIQIPLSQ